jgi:Protein of unknown function (DUF3006)
MPTEISHKTHSVAFIDRIENHLAVLIFSDETSLDVPLKQLPEHSQAGDFLDVTFNALGKAIEFTPNIREKENSIDRVEELQAELQQNDAEQMNIKL